MDVKEMVQTVQEYFGDFVALDSHLFLVPVQRTHVVLQPFAWDYGNASDAVTRMTEGLASLMLSLRRRFTVRYQRGSEVCERLAQAMHHLTTVEERELFDFGSRNGESTPVLLLVDRRDDPVTPLLSQVCGSGVAEGRQRWAATHGSITAGVGDAGTAQQLGCECCPGTPYPQPSAHCLSRFQGAHVMLMAANMACSVLSRLPCCRRSGRTRPWCRTWWGWTTIAPTCDTCRA